MEKNLDGVIAKIRDQMGIKPPAIVPVGEVSATPGAGLADVVRSIRDVFSPPAHVLAREAAMRVQRFESAALYDEAGEELFYKDGAQFSINFTDAEIAQMKNAVLTHNHPRGWDFPESAPEHGGNSFSDADIGMAARGDLKAIRAVSPSYEFTLERPAGGWGMTQDQVMRAYGRFDAQVKNEFLPRIQAGTLSMADANANHYHEVVSRMASANGWQYERRAIPR